jgi:tetrahydromethanopterin S-methyltransferase subunit C
MNDTMNPPSRVIASIFGLSAFAVAVLSGLAAGAAPTSTLVRAVFAMLVFHVVGSVVGYQTERVVRQVTPASSASGRQSGKSVDNSVGSSNNAGTNR